MKRRDIAAVIITALLAVALIVLARALPSAPKAPQGGALPGTATAAVTESAATGTDTRPESAAAPASAEGATATDTPSGDAHAAESGQQTPAPPAAACLSVEIAGVVYEPIPLTGENDLEIVQPDGKRNVVHFTPGSITMKEANCENGDCMRQGTVTTENTGARILGSMILCLPNQVILSLLTAEEAAGME